MKMNKKIHFFTLSLCTCFFTACSDDNDSSNSNNNGGNSNGYIYAVCYDSGDEGNAGYVMQVNDISQGSINGTQNINNRLEVTGNQDWVAVNDKYIYNFNYASQGADGISSPSQSWSNEGGKLVARSKIDMSGDVKTRGIVGKYVVSGSTQCKERDGQMLMYERIRIVDSETQAIVTANGRMETSTYKNKWAQQIGENLNFSDIASYGDGKYALIAFTTKKEDLSKGGTTDLAENTYLGVYELVAGDPKEEGQFFHEVKLIERKSADHPEEPAGQIAGNSRSRAETGIEPTDDGSIYVFCAGNKANAAEGSQYSPSAVLRISGDNIINGIPQDFDNDYYVNIRELSGGYQMWRSYYLGGTSFCLQMYNQKYNPADNSNGNAYKFAIFDAANKEFKWVTGDLDENKITSISLFCMIEKEKRSITFGIETADKLPALYTITAHDAAIRRGLEVKAEGIQGVARLKDTSK